jgi:hypothetical protein
MMLLRQHIVLMQREHDMIVESEVTALWKSVEAITDDEGRQFAGSDAMHLESRLREGVTTRYLGLSAVVAIWANYEAGVKEAAAYFAKRREVALTISDLRGSFVQQADRYFSDVLKFDLHPAETDPARLKEFSTIRNAVAHTNGRLSDLREGDRTFLQQLAKRKPGVRIEEDDWLVVSFDYVLEMFEFVDALLTNLFERVRRAFPARGAT